MIAVETYDMIFRYSFAPSTDLKQPDTLFFTLMLRMSLSAWLLSKGTSKSYAKRQTSPLRAESRSIRHSTFPRFVLPLCPGFRSGSGLRFFIQSIWASSIALEGEFLLCKYTKFRPSSCRFWIVTILHAIVKRKIDFEQKFRQTRNKPQDGIYTERYLRIAIKDSIYILQ